MDVVQEAKKIIEKKEYQKNCRPLYLFTNENLNAITQKINLENKKIITVCASSDQYFNFLLQNASEIATFDINKLTEYLFYFKKAAIINLDYNDFNEFLLPQRPFKKYILDKSIYQKIKKDMPDYVEHFWDELFKMYSSKELFNSNLFFDNKKNIKQAKNNNKYLENEENYLLLKNKLKSISKLVFYNINIFDNFINEEKKYDFIYLSNILDDIPANSKKEFLERLKFIVNNISNNLKEDGMIALNYLFAYLDDYWENTNNYIKKIVKEDLITNQKKLFDYMLIDFSGGLTYESKKPEDKDALILYKKK